MQFAGGEDEIVVASHSGKCIRFPETDVRPMGRDTMGVQAPSRSPKGTAWSICSSCARAATFSPSPRTATASVRIPEDYRLQSRGGKGIKAGVFNEKTGALVNMKMVTDADDVMLVTSSGVVIRMHAESISHIGRNTRGVRLMNVRDGVVATVAVTEKDEEAEVEAPEETAADLTPEELSEDADDATELSSEETSESPVSEDKDE